jgi:hypothetical protein
MKTARKKMAICRGSLAWLGRQTHNLEFARGKRLQPEVAGSNPAPGTNLPQNNLNLKLAFPLFCPYDLRIGNFSEIKIFAAKRNSRS